MPPPKRKLLAAPQTKRYFLVPADKRWARGTFVVFSIMQGQRFEVAESELVPFEVSMDEAKQWLSEQLLVFFHNAKKVGIDYMNRLKEWAVAEEEARSEPPPGPDLQHPFFDALRTLFAATKAPTTDEAERADAWARAVKETAKRHGETPPENLEEFAEPLQQLYKELDADSERDASAARLNELAKRVEASAALAAARIRQLARDLSGDDDVPPDSAELPPKPEPPAAPVIHDTTVVTRVVVVTAAPSDVPTPVEPPHVPAPPGLRNDPPASSDRASTAKRPPPIKETPLPTVVHEAEPLVDDKAEGEPLDEPLCLDSRQDAAPPPATRRGLWIMLIVIVVLILFGLTSAAIPLFHWLVS
jgi:hypothetical protein